MNTASFSGAFNFSTGPGDAAGVSGHCWALCPLSEGPVFCQGVVQKADHLTTLSMQTGARVFRGSVPAAALMSGPRGEGLREEKVGPG